jgi:hypothetical protein
MSNLIKIEDACCATVKTLLCAVIYFGGLATIAVGLIKLAIFIWAGIF